MRYPIIFVLGELDGRATKAQVLDEIERRGLIVPTTEDREIVSSGEERWRNRAAWERNALVNEGMIHAPTRGEWALTPAGWKSYEAEFLPSDEAAPTRNPKWEWDEIALALDVYVRAGCLNGGALPGKDDPAVLELSEKLKALPLHPASARAADFRDPPGVALKLANLRALERDARMALDEPGAESLPGGMGSYSRLDRAVFDTYFNNWDALAEEAKDTGRTPEQPPPALPPPDAPSSVASDAPVDGGGVPEYEASPANGGTRTRTEAELVLAYANHMSSAGHDVTGRHYRVPAESRVLRADLFVRDLNTLVEAKAAISRTAVRLAIGQLFDYRRFERSGPNLAVLLPESPSPDMLELLKGLTIGCIWPNSSGGFTDTRDGAITT
jgi:hypothetical protein